MHKVVSGAYGFDASWITVTSTLLEATYSFSFK